MKYTVREAVELGFADLSTDGGRRILHGIAWRLRRLRNRFRLAIGLRKPAPPRENVYSVGFRSNGERILRLLRQDLPKTGISLMTGGGVHSESRTVHVAVEDLVGLLEFVLEHAGDVEVLVRRPGKWRQPLSPQVVERIRERPVSVQLLVVERRLDAASMHVMCSRVQVAIWTAREGPYQTPYREVSPRFSLAARLRTQTFDELMSQRHDFDDDFPAPDRVSQPIDIVYTWVDGDDPEWRAAKQRYGHKPAQSLGERALHDERFRSRDELKYSLRSVAQFAPWVRKIHIVTADQQPEWLNVEHPKINLVSHSDIYRNPDVLPTFNSSGIETQLHHIPGLSRHFLYFNDDFMLAQLCEPRDFFTNNGMIRSFPSGQRAFEVDIDGKSEEYIQADRNAIELMKAEFDSVGREIMNHVPYPSDRLLLEELESKYQDEFDRCAASRFRSRSDLRPIAFFQYHYGYQHRRVLPSSISHRYLALWKPSIDEQFETVLRRRSHKTLCINDVGVPAERIAEVNELVFDFLESYFPEPSQFELVELGDVSDPDAGSDESGVGST